MGADDGGSIEVIGHRGAPRVAPENTLPSLTAALAAGAPSVEWDVRVSRCGTPVVIHDASVERTTDGEGRVEDLTARELADLDAGSWFSTRFTSTAVPTLAEALEVVRGAPGILYCEVKAVREPDDAGRIVQEVRKAGVLGRTVIISLVPEILDQVRALDPEIRIGWVVDENDAMEEAGAWVRSRSPALLDPRADLLLNDPERTRRLVAQGVPLVTWTVDDLSQARALVQMGVTRITTNEVSEMVAWARDDGGGLR